MFGFTLAAVAAVMAVAAVAAAGLRRLRTLLDWSGCGGGAAGNCLSA